MKEKKKKKGKGLFKGKKEKKRNDLKERKKKKRKKEERFIRREQTAREIAMCIQCSSRSQEDREREESIVPTNRILCLGLSRFKLLNLMAGSGTSSEKQTLHYTTSSISNQKPNHPSNQNQ